MTARFAFEENHVHILRSALNSETNRAVIEHAYSRLKVEPKYGLNLSISGLGAYCRKTCRV